MSLQQTTANALSASTVIAVIGTGAIGAGIAQVAAAAGHTVKLFDNRPGAAEADRYRISPYLQQHLFTTDCVRTP